MSSWVVDEMKTADLNDKRLNKRLLQIIDDLANQPTASIPAACGGAAETEAAYRLFDNDKVTFEKTIQPHINSTLERVATQPIVVVAQDTTELDLTRPEQQVEGAGPLDDGSRRGLLLHDMHAFTPDGTPLGTVHATIHVRTDDESVSKTSAERRATPIEEKESYRWVVALRQAHEVARKVPDTSIVCVADSEGDIYELLMEASAAPSNAHFIVRACQDRALLPDPDVEEPANSLREQLLETPVLYTKTISVRGRKAKVSCDTRGRRQPRESRDAEVEVRATRVTLRPPYRHARKLLPISINVVHVLEPNHPHGEPPVEWILLTDLPIDTVEQVCDIVAYYSIRWIIEIFFRTLKSGCRTEARRFEHIERYKRCLAVHLIVTWRTLYVCRLGRSCPDISCEAVFEPA